MKISFCKVDPMANVRRFKYLPDVTPWCAVLMALFLLIICAGTLESDCSKTGPFLSLPELGNGQDQPTCLETLTVHIFEDGTVYCGGQAVDIPSQLSSLLKETIKEENYSKEKVLAKIDQNAPFGVVNAVFKAISDADVKTIGLIGQAVFE